MQEDKYKRFFCVTFIQIKTPFYIVVLLWVLRFFELTFSKKTNAKLARNKMKS